jgi:hypothetical protein
MEAYLASLPRGLESYPACQQKAVILRSFVTPAMRPQIEAALPPEVRPLLEHMPAVTEWIPEVHATTIYLAARDATGSDEAYVASAYELNRNLLSGTMYRILFTFVSPARVLKGATSRWGQLHRGTELRPRSVGENEAVMRLSCPPNLVPPVLALAYGTAYRAAVELAGGRNVTVTCSEGGPGGYTYVAEWH